ncbi:MAG TPA: type II secretion system protein [Myxococcales bacterium]|jgi:prepilin-type N-terminal cleavage/methylation domain-containing protein
MRNDRGYTLIEAMVTIAILGVLMALAVGGWGSLSSKGAVQNAAQDFHSTLLNARQRATERGSDVWVIIYPYIDRTGNDAPNTNPGAYFVVEDVDLDFKTYYKDTFAPPSSIRPASPNALLEQVWLDTYPRHNARFLKTPIASGSAYQAPFNAMGGSGCSFCTGTTKKGAIVFNGEGIARFLNHDASEDYSRSASVTFSSFDIPLENHFLAITGPTGFVGIYP